jgi:hypothetical protein
LAKSQVLSRFCALAGVARALRMAAKVFFWGAIVAEVLLLLLWFSREVLKRILGQT